MTPFLDALLGLVAEHGGWMLFLMAIGETSFITGLVVPSGVATSVATILALQGHFSLATVALAAVAGGWVGDSVGFWIGRRGGAWLARGDGRLAREFRARRSDADRIFGRHPAVSVTFARWVSFVRTVMPMAAGMSELSYRRFLAYEAVGVTVWAALYMLLGAVAGESWEMATRVAGVGGALLFAIASVVLWRLARRRARTAS